MARPPRSTVHRRRASHSLEAVVAETVALLDEADEQALTFRALAARLGGGVGSIYWYVASKEELLDRASDHVLADVLAQTADLVGSKDPLDDVRSMAVALFTAISRRPWLGAYFLRNTETQPHALLYFERLGEQILRLDLGPRASLHAVSAVLGFVIGTAADRSTQPPPEVLDGTVSREEYAAAAADVWRESDPEAFPFLHHVVDEFASHDDTELFLAGLDLLLAGLRLQAER